MNKDNKPKFNHVKEEFGGIVEKAIPCPKKQGEKRNRLCVEHL